jgi:hypothetical protein
MGLSSDLMRYGYVDSCNPSHKKGGSPVGHVIKCFQQLEGFSLDIKGFDLTLFL